MIKGVERLFEAITGPGWQVEDEVRGVLGLYNSDRTRRLSYEGITVENGTHALLEMSYLNGNGGWSEIFSMRHFSTDRGKEMTFVVWTRGDWEKPRWFDEMVSYDTRSERRIIGDGGSMPKPPFSGRVAEDRRELLYNMSELPGKLDFEMTANLFIGQMIRGEMERPILVPEGLFTFVEPEQLYSGVWAYDPNITRAAKLFVSARTAEELRVAGAINRYVFEQETARRQWIQTS